jgi:SAM-dependent methyltransferase
MRAEVACLHVKTSGMSAPICDYEGSQYQREFWIPERAYEDAVERLALRALLPPTGNRILEIGAGYGRLADLYAGYKQIFLLDYARTQMEQAREFLKSRPGVTLVVGDLYNLPFNDGFFDTVVTVRVLHHIAGIPAAFAEVARILTAGGAYVLEYANKRNLKAVIRYLLRRQPSPFSREPWEFVKLNFDFHPAYMADQLKLAGLEIHRQRAASLFRVGFLKRTVPTGLLAGLDGWLQAPLGGLKPAPSVFLETTVAKPAGPAPVTPWRCPQCHSAITEQAAPGDPLACPGCGARWRTDQGIYDFKTPLP